MTIKKAQELVQSVEIEDIDAKERERRASINLDGYILLAQVGERVARIQDRDERQNIASCADILAALRFEKDLIRQSLREDMMQESVTYQDILSKGKKQEALSLVTRQLNRRLGNVSHQRDNT
jgi:predicted transposase YdaD